MNKFEKMGIDEDFNPLYQELGIKHPNEVQEVVIPKIMGSKSLICVAQTGSGKTLSFALPIAELIKRIEDEQGLNENTGSPQAVVVVPTKELALQITDVFKQISHHAKLRIRSLVTSKNLKQQGFEVLVTTPSKLSVALKKKELSFRDLRYLVFDEADQLFDMGFKRDIEGIIKFVEFDEVDIHFFSATMPVDVETFLKEKFRKKNLEMIQLGSAHKTQQRIETFNLFIQPEEKLAALEAFIKRTAQGRGIVFVNQKNQVEEVNKFLLERLPTLKFKILHGDLPEKLRISNIKSFMQKKSHILVASDVAARGMDIKDLDWVLNFGLPKSPIYYLHRCGRTGRAGREGRVYNFVTSFDSKLISQINQSIREQSHMDIGLISDKTTKKKTSKEVQRPKKTKRLKVTKRTRH